MVLTIDGNWLAGSRSRRAAAGALACLVGSLACGGSSEPEPLSNPDDPTEAELIDFGTAEVREPSAFDVVSSSPVRVAQNSRWDFVFFLRPDGTAHFKPRGLIIGERSDAGLQKLVRPFEEVDQVPATGYQRVVPMEVEVGDVLAVQSQRDASFGNLRCRRYGKLEILAIDAGAGTITFQHLINPNCENRNTTPGAAVPLSDQQ